MTLVLLKDAFEMGLLPYKSLLTARQAAQMKTLPTINISHKRYVDLAQIELWKNKRQRKLSKSEIELSQNIMFITTSIINRYITDTTELKTQLSEMCNVVNDAKGLNELRKQIEKWD